MKLREKVDEAELDTVLADGFDAACLGYAEREGVHVLVYDVEKALRILQRRDGMTYEEAQEFFDFNVRGAWVGLRTPIWLSRL